MDTGLKGAAENIALNKTLMDCHKRGITPNTLRFLRFRPAALIGYHQDVDQEINVGYCKKKSIDIQRRLTGGGAILMDENVLGWELYTDKKEFKTSVMNELADHICTAVANGISTLGVEARFRPRNDIEVNGRKIGGTGGTIDGDTILYQGTILLDFNIEEMLRVLNIPAEKHTDKAISSAGERVVSLKTLLGEPPSYASVQSAIIASLAHAFDIEFYHEGMNSKEQSEYLATLEEIDSTEWVYQHRRPKSEAFVCEAIKKTPGGLLRARLYLDVHRNLIKQVWFTGDFFVKPKRVILDLEAKLKDTPINQYDKVIMDYFGLVKHDMMGLTPDDFVDIVKKSLTKANNITLIAPQ